jgi:UDP:flavonoid glycosyltransferase YjiC (YdhE family)
MARALSRFLLGWELGGGLGHVGTLVPVARALQREGHQAMLALRDLRPLSIIPAGAGTPVLQAPCCIHNYDGLADPPLNYTEILMRYGYLDEGMLFGLVAGWRGLLELTRADVLVADHAPSALLAAITLGVPRIAFGTPFVTPPRQSPMPNMRHWIAVAGERLAEGEVRVLNVVNAVLARFGTPPLASLCDLFDVDATLMLTFRELDHYPQRPAADLARIAFCGPIASTGAGTVEPPWPAGPGQRIFAYLKPEYPHLDAILRALAAAGQPTVIYGLGAAAPGFQGSAPQLPAAAKLAFSARPVDLEAAGRECAIGICHAGTTTAALLQAGRPLLLLPTQLEQFMGGLRVADLGAGIVINPEVPAPDIGGALARLLAEPAFAERAAQFAAKYRDLTPDKILSDITTRMAAVAAGTKRAASRRKATT